MEGQELLLPPLPRSSSLIAPPAPLPSASLAPLPLHVPALPPAAAISPSPLRNAFPRSDRPPLAASLQLEQPAIVLAVRLGPGATPRQSVGEGRGAGVGRRSDVDCFLVVHEGGVVRGERWVVEEARCGRRRGLVGEAVGLEHLLVERPMVGAR